MATGKSPTKFRSWSSTDSEDPGDIHRLYDSETSTKSSSGKCVSTWAFSLMVLSFCVLFLLGLLVGYYVRESQTVDSSAVDHSCNEGERSDRFTSDQVYTAHENVMYFMSALNIKHLYSDLDTDKDQSSGSEWDGGAVEFIQSEFVNYGLDNVQVEEYNVVVTYPDPINPNRLEVVSSENQLQLNVTFDQMPKPKASETENEMRPNTSEKSSIYPYVALTVAGTVEGPLLYGHYGRQVDLLKLNKTGATLTGSVLIVRLGQVSVSEKFRVAAEWGVLGVLFYIDPVDLNFKVKEEVRVVPYASAGEYQVSGSRIAAVPAQTISMDTARVLLEELQGRVVPASWNGGLHNIYRYGKTDSSQLKVRLSVNNKETNQKVRHVIGTLQGDMETDRYVMIGASRTSFYRNQNNNMATAHLMELARNMASVRKLEKWGLRRGVKFCSWGGNELAGVGQSEYLKVNDPIIKMKAVAYIDLDLTINHNQRSSTDIPMMEVTANKILSILVQDVVAQVPDPTYPEIRVSDNWSGVLTYRKHVDPAEYLHGNVNHVFRLKEIGVPVVQPGYILPTSMTNEDSLQDEEHHFKYHLGATRVAALVLLCLVDDRELLINVQLYTMSITDNVKKSTQLLRQYAKPSDIEKLLRRSDNLRQTGKAFQDYVMTMKPTEKSLTIRGINDIVMSLDKAFISPPDLRRYASLLYETTENGQLSIFQNMISRIKAGEKGVDLNHAVEALLTALDQCNASLQLS